MQKSGQMKFKQTRNTVELEGPNNDTTRSTQIIMTGLADSKTLDKLLSLFNLNISKDIEEAIIRILSQMQVSL